MTLQSHAIRLAQGRLGQAGVWVERAAPLADVRRLIKDLRIESGSHPLVRVGPAIDGGYLLPDDLEGIAASVSPGVSTEVGFDLALAERGIDIYMADASVGGPPVDHPRFNFSRRFLDTYTSDTTTTLDDLVATIPSSDDLILQMDIEGAEWRVFNSLSPAALARFRIMAIEFHDLGSMFSRFGFREINGVFRKLLATHAVVHIHPNNVTEPVTVDGLAVPPLMEFTFHRRDRGRFTAGPATIPHPLDAPCTTRLADYPLPACWYMSS